jgi:peptide/nickel transport system substrate-binding protein
MSRRGPSFDLTCALALFLALFLFAVRPAAAEDAQTITLVRGGESLWLDPARAFDTETILVNNLIYEGLVRLQDAGTRIEPCLAESWAVSPDGLAWTFRLRRGVLFHDGTELKAQAVVDSFMRQIDPKHPAHTPGMYQAKALFSQLSAVEALDDSTVRFRLSRPVAALLTVLTSPVAAIVSPAALQRRGVDLAHSPVGTGPFRFESNRRGVLALTRNPSYWGGKARVERLVMRTVPDSAERFRMMQAGRADVMTGIPPADLPLLDKMPGVRVLRTPGLNVAYLAMNTRRGAMRRVEVRRAVQLALDKPGIVRLAYGVLAEPACGLIPLAMLEGAPHLAEILPPLRPDPAAARRVLAKEGLLSGPPLTLMVMDTPRSYMPEPMRVAQAVRQSLAAVGLKVAIKKASWVQYLSIASRGDYDLCLLGWVTDTPDPHEMLRNLIGWDELNQGLGSNVTFWQSERYQALVQRAELTRDTAERLDLYAQALRIARDEAPLVPLAHVQEFVAVRRNISGVVQQPVGAVLRFDKAVRQ